MPPAPAYASPPPLWGDEEHVRALFDGRGVELAFTRGHNPWRFASAEEYVTFMATHYGPLVKAKERLSGEGAWDEFRREFVALAQRSNEATDGRLLLLAEYLVVTAEVK